MKYIDRTLSCPAGNLACDEALLDWCESEGGPEVLRFWEPASHFVVAGYANRVEQEVVIDACAKLDIPILRRCSGGGTVLQGPGCLNYSLVLSADPAGPLASISGANLFIMERHRTVLSKLLGQPVKIQGHTDLAAGGLKFSGNAQRRRKNSLLFHGTFLLALNIPLVQRLLRFPSKQPAYRQDRSHQDFMTNLPIDAPFLKNALRQAWGAAEPLMSFPEASVTRLVLDRYGNDRWTFKF